MIVQRSSGEEVELKISSVDRSRRRVTIDVPAYNSRFTFSDVTGKISLIENGRQLIDESLLATTHVSKSVYAGLAMWAGSVLNDRR